MWITDFKYQHQSKTMIDSLISKKDSNYVSRIEVNIETIYKFIYIYI